VITFAGYVGRKAAYVLAEKEVLLNANVSGCVERHEESAYAKVAIVPTQITRL
jgi:hypothetical protein